MGGVRVVTLAAVPMPDFETRTFTFGGNDQHPLHPQVDEVRFYNRALSAVEIAVVKNAQ